MKIRNLLLCIIILLTFIPIVVYAQLDINRLQSGKRGFGFGYRSSPDYYFPHSILITGEYGITENIKYSGQTSIAFDPDYFEVMELEFRNQIMHIDSLKSSSYDVGDADFGYFLLGGIDIKYLYISEDGFYPTGYKEVDYPVPALGIVVTVEEVEGVEESAFFGLNLFAGGGFYASFGPLKPFVHYTFNHARVFQDFGGGTENFHRVSGGIHFNFSESISLMGRAVLPRSHGEFQDPFFEIGINFGLGKKTKQPRVETPITPRLDKKVEQPPVETPTTPGLVKKVEQPPVETPTTPGAYRFKKNDTLLIKVKDYLYFAKVTEDTKTTAKDVPVQFFINDINLIAGDRVLLNTVHAKREKPKDGWGSQKVTIEYYDGTAWKKMSGVLVFEDFYLLPETVSGERRVGLDKIRIPNPSY